MSRRPCSKSTRFLHSVAVAVGCFSTALVGCGRAAPPRVAAEATSPAEAPLPPWYDTTAGEGGQPHSQGQPIAIVGATLLLGNGERVTNGTLVMRDGRIEAVGRDVQAPAGAAVVDGRGKFVTPGLIDTHSHLGVYPLPHAKAHRDGNEMTNPSTAGVRTIDAFWPQDPAIERALAGGVTTLQVLPGSANLIGGRAVTLKLRDALSARGMRLAGAPDGLKMACGENPKRVYGKNKKAPMTRMGNLAGQRQAFFKALELRDEWARWRIQERQRLTEAADDRAEYEAERQERALRERWCKKTNDDRCEKWRDKWSDDPLDPPDAEPGKGPPDRDIGAETLIGAIEGSVLVHIHCYRADDMLNMIALAEEMGFRIRSFHHALEAYKIRDELAKQRIATSTWADWWGFKLEAYDGIPENAALVAEAGGRTIIHSDSWEGIQRLNQEAAKALYSGRRAGVDIDEDDALVWITRNPAWALGIDHLTGTLETGKHADVVLWDKSPFSVYAAAERVWVDGIVRHDKNKLAAPHSDFELGQPAREDAR